ncbi:type II toxin-antitoxin system VapC family toxin [Metallosphaera tengchongensis]|uniref:Type II toxin-antitoxin system VapC family toxin n=1 Tax=Metallosphaera tengchongensis TaxID=1532350 RepID=A0A6N0NV74_9CREN|nr:type II toxin-antitoxin system VapC family toxin [Metallosphaera tengchongensis]QKR00632.1 type II toxin-antitoxin system VapC family toxin [Metallosphaera tengchongensis]
MKKRVVIDTGFFFIYFSGLNDRAKELMIEIYNGSSLAMTTDLNLTEFFYNYSKIKGAEASKVKTSLILGSPIKVVPTDKDLALRAGQLKVQSSFLSIVDCYVISLAEREGAKIYTTDSGIKKVYANTVLLLEDSEPR